MTNQLLRRLAPIPLLLLSTLAGRPAPREGVPAAGCEEVLPARLVRAEVRWKDELMLRASTSDDGAPDADDVWAYLDNLQFRPTEAFEELLEDNDRATFVLGSEPKARDIEVMIAYGGQVDVWKLEVRRIDTEDGSRWKLDRKVLRDFRELRWIQRAWADDLR